MYSIHDQPFHVQGMKVKVADLLKEYHEIKVRRIYHKIAYRYEIDAIIDKVANYFDEAARIGEEALSFIQSNGMASLDNLPPVIIDRISEIIAAFSEDNPNMSATDNTALIGALFAEGGEFDGLINDDKTVNREWLDKYLSDPNHLPDKHGNVHLTQEMEDDLAEIESRSGLTQDQKDDIFSELFHEGGKYEGYIQKDGTTDVTKIVKRN